MASLREQLDIHKASKLATASLEASSRASILSIFDMWEAGILDARTVRYRLEASIRSAYRSSAGVAREVALRTSELDGWDSAEVFNTEYLQSLLSDVRRNLRDYKSELLTKEQAVSRMEHSAGVAAQRGYTDQIISSYSELEDFGLRVEKYWVANFVDNSPCPSCRRLHGTSVGLQESFRERTGEPGVYRDLIGPPRHPRCQCRLFMFVRTLENSFESPNFEEPQEPVQMVSSRDVRNMSKGIFSSVMATLRAVLKFFRRKK